MEAARRNWPCTALFSSSVYKLFRKRGEGLAGTNDARPLANAVRTKRKPKRANARRFAPGYDERLRRKQGKA